MMMLPPDPSFVIYSDISINCLVFSNSSNYLYSGGLDGVVRIWNLETYQEINHLKISDESIISLLTTGEPELLIVHDKNGVISLWTNQTSSWKKCWTEATDFMGFCSSKLLGDVLMAPLASGAIAYYTIPTGNKIQTNILWGPNASGELMAFEPFEKRNEKMIIAASEGNLLGVWTWAGSQVGESLKLEECAMALTFDNERMRGAAGGPHGVFTIFNVNDNGLTIFKIIKLSCPGIAALKIRPDKKLIAAGCWDGRLRLLSWKSFVNLATLTMHDSSVQALAFSNGRHFKLAAGCKDGRISIWDIYNDKR